MLSDACSDFGSHLEKGAPIKEATEKLLMGVEWYGRPDYPLDYPPEHIQALREAANAVLANPEDKQLAQKLMTLAEAVREYYDSGGRVPLNLEAAEAA
jgi:hypothetical protein